MNGTLLRIFLLYAFLGVSGSGIAAPIYLDAQFGSNANGTVTQAVGVESEASAILIRDNKINVIGTSLIGGVYHVTIARYLQTGMLDTSFGTGGILNITFQEGFTASDAFAYDADRMIILGSAIVDKSPLFVGVRLYNDGTFDPTLGGAGVGIYPAYGLIQGGVLKADGKLVVITGGAVGGNEQLTLYLAGVNENGSLDFGFGSDGTGIVKIPLPWSSMYAKAICMSANKIIIAGYVGVNGSEKIFCARIGAADGAFDTTFGTDGVVITPMPEASIHAHAHGVGVQSTGKIVVSGAAGRAFVALRYTIDGILDDTFGTNGIVSIPVGTYAHGYTSVIQSDDKIVIAGLSDDRFAVVRLLSDGALDTTFGDGGMVSNAIGSFNRAQTIALQSDGKIVVAGSADNKMAVARYLADNNDFVDIIAPLADATIATGVFAITGTASQSDRMMRVKVDDALIATVITDSAGNWSVAASPVIADGVHTLLVEMVNGESVIASHSHAITISAASDEMVILTPTAGATVTTQTPVISGRATHASYNVRVYVDGAVVDTVTTDALGAWQLTSSALVTGGHTILAELLSGEAVLASGTKTCTVSVPAFIAFDTPVLGSTVTTSTVAITGKASGANMALQIFFDGQFFAAVTTDAAGAWDAGVSGTLADNSTHSIAAYATTAAGAVLVMASTYFTVDLP